MNSPAEVTAALLPAHHVQVMAGQTIGETYLICRQCPDGGTGLGLSYAHPLDSVFELQTGTGKSSVQQLLDWIGVHQDQDPEVAPDAG